MKSIQPESQKIKKKPKGNFDMPRNFICGRCDRTYASYPTLYCHIKRKHDGIAPSGTKVHKAIKVKSQQNLICGRHQKVRLSNSVFSYCF